MKSSFRFGIAFAAMLLRVGSDALAHLPYQPPHEIAPLGDLQPEARYVISDWQCMSELKKELKA